MKNVNIYKNIAVVLTCTIDVQGIFDMERNDVNTRFDDYLRAFRKWLIQDTFINIIFVENSGADLTKFRELAKASKKKVEFISFNGQDFDRKLGKGFGEQSALSKLYEDSSLIREVNGFLKVNGRYFLQNHYKVNKVIDCESNVVCDLSKMLTWADSRVFYSSNCFYQEFLAHELKKVNDVKGIFFEHALAKAVLKLIANDGKWQLMPNVDLIGISGTSNKSINNYSLKGAIKKLSFTVYYSIKKKTHSCHWR